MTSLTDVLTADRHVTPGNKQFLDAKPRVDISGLDGRNLILITKHGAETELISRGEGSHC